MFRNKLSKVAIWPHLSPFIYIFMLFVWVCGCLGFFCIWIWCIAWNLRWHGYIISNQLSFSFFAGIPCCTLHSLMLWPYVLPVLPHQLSCFSYYNWTNISLPFVIPCIKINSSTKLSVMSSCHQFTKQKGRKHLSFSISTKTVIQNYNPGHIISSRTFSATFIGDEGAKASKHILSPTGEIWINLSKV